MIETGDILIASYKGVFRYDGKSFTNMTSTIRSPSFWDVLEDRKGNLWLATRDSGVYYYNGQFFQHFTVSEGLASNAVFSICEDKAGNIWFATGGGASRYDGKSFRNLTTKEGLSNNGRGMWYLPDHSTAPRPIPYQPAIYLIDIMHAVNFSAQ